MYRDYKYSTLPDDPVKLFDQIVSAAFRKLILECCSKEEIIAAYDNGLFPIVDSLPKDYDIDNCIAAAVVQDTASVILQKRLREIVYAICVEITEHKISHTDFVIHLLEKVLYVAEMVGRIPDTLTCSIEYNNTSLVPASNDKYISLSELHDNNCTHWEPPAISMPVPASNDKYILSETSYKDFYKPSIKMPYMVVTTDNNTADETESHADGTIQPDI